MLRDWHKVTLDIFSTSLTLKYNDIDKLRLTGSSIFYNFIPISIDVMDAFLKILP